MNVEAIRSFLAWCTVGNLLLLLVWWGSFVAVGDWIYGLHGRWFKISRATFDAVQYGAMATFKLLVFAFNLVPYLVLRFAF